LIATTTSYDSADNTELQGRVDEYQTSIDRMNDDALSFKNNSENLGDDPNFVDVLGFMFKSGWTAAKSSVTMTGESSKIVSDVADDTNAPSYIKTSIIIILILIVGFALVALATGRK
jgi:hypothetical protein